MLKDNFQLKSDLPKMTRIINVIDEMPGYKTFLFSYPFDCQPGQFLMIWLPRIDEKPFTLSYKKDDILGITVQLRGKFTEELFKLKKGDSFGVRGGYGNCYRVSSNKKTCIITGGSGTAAVLPLACELHDPKIIIGARSKDSLLFIDKLPHAIFTTEDGSYGFHGNVVSAFIDLISKTHIDMVYTCGPEKMMDAVIQICVKEKIECQFALERYMKCGFGICGNCTCGKKRVCVDGPIFKLSDLKDLSEFSTFIRTKSGKIEKQ
jgi:dihydroorotate dehydrogenase electron transfer subunit